MNRKFRTIAVAVLLLGVASLVGGCKKCTCGNDDGGGGSPINTTTSGENKVETNCVQFTDNMLVKLLCVSESDTSRLELDGACINEFCGTQGQVTKIVANGSHRILCYTVGTTDTVVNVSFEQNQNGVTNWTSNIHL